MNAPISPNLGKYLLEAQQGSEAAREIVAQWMLHKSDRLAAMALLGSPRTMDRSSLISNSVLKLVRSDVIARAPNADYLQGAVYKAVAEVLIDRYRKLGRQKRHRDAGGILNQPWWRAFEELNIDLQELERGLEELQALDPRKASVVRLRFFWNMTVKEVAGELNVSVSTVENDWKLARLWLFKWLGGGLG